MEKKIYDYRIYSPGGNETALVSGIEYKVHIRKFINDIILQKHSNKSQGTFRVEQVGFINKDNISPRLMMAGGEFCGNATRSAAWYYSGETVGEINISVSGVTEPLKAGVKEIDKKYESWAQMPFYRNLDRIKKIDEGYFRVELEGITHIVVSEEYANEHLVNSSKAQDFEEDLKGSAIKLLKKYGLDNTNAGVIFLEKTDEGIKMHPCVIIPGISSYYETACGSGTIAVGLVQCFLKKTSIEISLIQPSNQVIKAIVDYDGNEVTNAVICGSVKTVGVWYTLPVPIFETLQIKNAQQLNEFDKINEAINLYGDCFKEFPYCEELSEKIILERLLYYCDNGILLFGMDDQNNERKIMSFAAAVPLEKDTVVLEVLKTKGIECDPAKDWYHADIGVTKSYRGNKIAHLLGRELFELIPAERIFMRTHEKNNPSIKRHENMGFTIIENSLHESPPRKKICGREESDKSILLVLKKK